MHELAHHGHARLFRQFESAPNLREERRHEMSVDQIVAVFLNQLHSFLHHEALVPKHVHVELFGDLGRMKVNVVVDFNLLPNLVRRTDDVDALKMRRELLEHFIEHILLSIGNSSVTRDHEELLFDLRHAGRFLMSLAGEPAMMEYSSKTLFT